MIATANQTQAIQNLNGVFRLQKEAYLKNAYPSAEKRIELMQRVPPMLKEYRTRIHEALHENFGYHRTEMADLFEIVGMFDRAKFNIENIKKWIKPIPKAGNPVTQGSSKQFVQYHPKGVVGNMVSWNFPFDIAIGPMLDQLSAGNRVIIKPSDLAPACRAILDEMIKKAQPSMGFGGVEASERGRHHGIEGFREFSYPRGYFEMGKGGTTDWILPPYTKNTRKLINDVALAPLSKQLKFALSRLPNILFKR